MAVNRKIPASLLKLLKKKYPQQKSFTVGDSKRIIKEQKQYDKMKMSYGVFSTNYEDVYAFSLLNSSVVQNDNFRLDKELNL